MASITKIGKSWRAQIYVVGMRDSATFERKTDAQAWAKSRENEFREIVQTTGGALSKDRRKFLELSELYSEERIIATAFSAKPAAGIYFLICDKRIVYVGKSLNVHSRIATHQKNKQFEQINFIECPAEYLHRLEQMYIQKFNPELNIAGRADHLPKPEEIKWQA